MKQYGVLAAVFGGTLAVLLVAFLVIEQLGGSGAAAVPSPSPSASPLAVASARPTATRRPTPSTAASGAPSPSPTPSPTPAPTPRRSTGPVRSIAPPVTFDVVVDGQDYATRTVAVNGKITRNPDGGITMTSDRTYSETTSVIYKLPSGHVPPGTVIRNLDTAICGRGSGDFWETYGPPDADPVEHEVTQPERDGCWHYLGGAGRDSTAHAIIQNQTTMTIDKVVYTVTVQ